MNCHYCKNSTGMCDMCRPQRINTTITMPEKIWAGGDESRYQTFWSSKPHPQPEMHQEQLYIRADIAEELARALFNMCLEIEQDGERPYDAAQSALSRYRNAIDTQPQPSKVGAY